MKYFAATYGDFVRFDAKPNEDCYRVSKKFPIFAVADGVTQAHYKTGQYVFPKGAKEAAEIFCRATISHLEKPMARGSKRIIKHIKEAFNRANEKIKILNEKYGIDKKMNYVEYDWFDTVGVAGIIAKNTLSYGFVGDCGLAIFDRNNKKKFQTKDMVLPAIKRFRKTYKDYKKLLPSSQTIIIHKDFRNNPNKKGYGSFTGEPTVQNYYKIGSKKLEKGDLIVFYSDGFFELLKDKDFIKILREKNRQKLDALVMKKAKENPEKYGGDRTFVALEFNG